MTAACTIASSDQSFSAIDCIGLGAFGKHRDDEIEGITGRFRGGPHHIEKLEERKRDRGALYVTAGLGKRLDVLFWPSSCQIRHGPERYSSHLPVVGSHVGESLCRSTKTDLRPIR